jgi:RNA recognition motif-containing protein
MNIYVGNLSHDTTEEGLREAFEKFGQVDKVNIIMDKFSGRSKGFGFVEMASKEEAEAAISGLNNQELDGRTLNVSEARPRTERGGGRGPGGGRGQGGGRGYGGGRGQGGGRRRY